MYVCNRRDFAAKHVAYLRSPGVVQVPPIKRKKKKLTARIFLLMMLKNYVQRHLMTVPYPFNQIAHLKNSIILFILFDKFNKMSNIIKDKEIRK
jgi:hypothetical protein